MLVVDTIGAWCMVLVQRRATAVGSQKDWTKEQRVGIG